MQPTPTKAEARLSKTQTNKRDNKPPIGKQYADNQSEESKNLRGERERKKEKQEGGKTKIFIYLFIFILFFALIAIIINIYFILLLILYN